MPIYIVGVRRTEKGHQSLKEFSSVMDRAAKIREAHGGKLINAYSTFGRFDFVAEQREPDAAHRVANLYEQSGGSMGINHCGNSSCHCADGDFLFHRATSIGFWSYRRCS